MKKLDDIKYDLALIYAQAKLERALKTNSVPSDDPQPDDSLETHEVEYLAECFYRAQEELDKLGESVFISESTTWLEY